MEQALVLSKLNVLLTSIEPERQLGWLQLANAKKYNYELLEKKELELQGLLLGYDKMTVEELQVAIDSYKEGLKQLPDIRKAFTSYLDNIKTQMMLPEKRAAVYEGLRKAEELFLKFRLDNEKKQSEVNLKTAEQIAFVTHGKNQYIGLRAKYEEDLSNIIYSAYEKALNDDNITGENVGQYIKTIELVLNDVMVGTPVKFEYKLNTKEELRLLASKIEVPNWTEILTNAKVVLDEKFSMLLHDKQNKIAAAEALKTEKAKDDAVIKAQAEKSTAINNLMAQSGNGVTVLNNIKELKRKTSIVVKDDDSRWAKMIVATFLANWDVCFEKLKVKKWGNLSVSHMSVALDDAGIKVDGVEYTETVK